MSTSTPVPTTTSTWSVDPAHSQAEFAVRHLMIATVRGSFSGIEGTLRLDEEDPAGSAVELRIDAASVDTRQEQRDEHLRSADFFDVANHPAIEFRSSRIEPVGKGTFRVLGDLTIRGVTRPIELTVREEGRVRDPWGGDRVGFSVEGRLDRTEYGLTWNQVLEAGGVAVSHDVRLRVDVEFVKQD